MNPLKKINGNFSELISNEAGIPRQDASAKKVQTAHRIWKKKAKIKKVEYQDRTARYWEKMSACPNL